jgi:hypothetical protein
MVYILSRTAGYKSLEEEIRMFRKLPFIVLSIIVFSTLLLAACNPIPSVTYAHVIVDTYVPTLANAGLVVGFDAVDLYSLSGGSLHLIASDHSGSNPDADATGFAYIDYQGGLMSGTYYIRIESANPGVPTNMGPYAIRVLAAPDTSPRDPAWYFAADNNLDKAVSYKVLSGGTVKTFALSGSAYESDDIGPPTFQPLATMKLDQALNRSLGSSGDVDWITLTLP